MFTSIVRLASEGEEHNPLLPEWIEVILALVVFGLLTIALAIVGIAVVAYGIYF